MLDLDFHLPVASLSYIVEASQHLARKIAVFGLNFF